MILTMFLLGIITWHFFINFQQSYCPCIAPKNSFPSLSGPDKSIAQLPGTSPNFGWASEFLFHLPRKMYRIYREYCNSEPFSRCCRMPGKWLKLGFVRPCIIMRTIDLDKKIYISNDTDYVLLQIIVQHVLSVFNRDTALGY